MFNTNGRTKEIADSRRSKCRATPARAGDCLAMATGKARILIFRHGLRKTFGNRHFKLLLRLLRVALRHTRDELLQTKQAAVTHIRGVRHSLLICYANLVLLPAKYKKTSDLYVRVGV